MNTQTKSYLRGLDVMLPHEMISSDQIENELSDVYQKLKLPVGRIEFQTNIKTRGIFHQNFLPSSIAALAAENLIKNQKINLDEIDLLIYSGVCRDQLEPSTASRVHFLLNLPPSCQSFDLSNACLGFVNSIQIASDLVMSGRYKNILITTGENSRSLIDQTIEKIKNDNSLTRKSIKPLFANFTIGSMGVSALVSAEKDNGNSCLEIGSSVSLSDTQSHQLCMGSGDINQLVMETNSTELLKRGVSLASKTFQHLLALGYHREQFKYLVCHQVGVAHQRALLESLKLDPKRDYLTFDRYGNTGSAALPFTLYQLINDHKIEHPVSQNDNILLLGIASGVHCQLMVVKKC